MSDSSKSSRASMASLLLQRFKQLLTSPYGVAAIASLSFHGVLFAAVPRFSSVSFAAFSEEDGTSESRTVPLVTLSAVEQGRLPNFNQPQLPSVPELPSNTTRNSTIIRNLPSASTLTPRSNIFNRYSSRNRTTPPAITRRRLFNNPHSISIIDTPSRSEQSNQRRDEPVVVPPPPPEDTLETELEIEKRQAEAAARAVESEQAAEGLPELPENSSEVLEPETDNVDEIAANTETAAEPTQLERLQAKFKYDAANTSEEEANTNYQKWVALGEEPATDEADDEPAVETAEPSALEIDSGLSLCVANPPNNGVVGVLVTPDGTANSPTVIRSTGYDYLNQAALDTIVASEFPEADVAIRYPFKVVVNYDDAGCQSSDDLLDGLQDTEQSAAEQQ
ncbi:MAG: hypothetical protein AAF579_14480 [Cyanobacteria bacterium P01_C01_bin.118]